MIVETTTQAADRHLGRIEPDLPSCHVRALANCWVRDLSRAGTRSRPVRQHPCVPTSTETPIERGSVIRCDRQGVNRENGSGCRASPGGRAGPPLPEFEGLSIRQIADRLGRSPATIKAYFYDPTGEKARAVKARYVGVCRGCGAYTQPRNGKGDAYAYCKALPPRRDRAALDARAGARRDARVARAVRPAAVVVRLVAHARAPARGRGARAARREESGRRRASSPACSVRGRPPARWPCREAGERLASGPSSATSPLGSNSISLPKPRESTAKSDDLRGGVSHGTTTIDLQGFSVCGVDFAHNSGR